MSPYKVIVSKSAQKELYNSRLGEAEKQFCLGKYTTQENLEKE